MKDSSNTMTNAILTWVPEGLVLSSGNLAGSEPVNLLWVCPQRVGPQTHLLRALCSPAVSTYLVSTGDLWANMQCRRTFNNSCDFTALIISVLTFHLPMLRTAVAKFSTWGAWWGTRFLRCDAIVPIEVKSIFSSGQQQQSIIRF